VFLLASIDDLNLDSTASHPSSSSHSLPCRVVCHPEHPMLTIMCGLVLLRMLRLLLLSLPVDRWSAVGFGFGYGYGRK